MTLFQKLRDSKAFIHVACAGAGSSLIHELWSEPGASAWLDGASFIYSPESMNDFLGFSPEKSVCEDTAIYMAMKAYQNAYKWGRENPIGVGVTASVASLVEHRGDHRAHYAIVTNDSCYVNEEKFSKGIGKEYRECDEIDVRMSVGWMLEELLKSVKDPAWLGVELGSENFLEKVLSYHDLSYTDHGPCAIYPGAFNPPHAGHHRFADMVRVATGKEVVYHINIDHPIKGTLTGQQILQRKKLLANETVFFTRELPLYIDLAKAYPGTPIVIGTDAIQRMLDPKWGPNVDVMVDQFCDLGTVFYVGERVIEGKVLTLAEVLKTWNGSSVSDNDAWTKVIGVTGPENSTEIRNNEVIS